MRFYRISLSFMFKSFRENTIIKITKHKLQCEVNILWKFTTLLNDKANCSLAIIRFTHLLLIYHNIVLRPRIFMVQMFFVICKNNKVAIRNINIFENLTVSPKKLNLLSIIHTVGHRKFVPGLLNVMILNVDIRIQKQLSRFRFVTKFEPTSTRHINVHTRYY